MSENTKLVRIESVVDRALAAIIQWPAPVTSIVVFVWTAVWFGLGAWL